MKKYCSYSMVLVLLLISSSMAMANDVYIAQTATGAGDGTSCSSARAVSFFNAVGNWGVGTDKIGPGTTVHLCGTFNAPAGSNYLTFQASGTVGNPITLKWEDGAIIQAPYFSQGNQGSGGGVRANGKSYLVIDGGTNGILRNTANGSGLTYQKSSTGIEIYKCNNIEIKNLAISNIYVRKIGDTVMDHGTLNFINSSGNYIEIHHNVMHDAGWGINWAYSNGDHDIRVHHNEIYNIDHGFSPYGDQGGSADNVYFYNNHVHDYSNWDWTGYHHDGIHAYGVNGSKLKTIYIYNNTFDGNTGTTITAHIFLEAANDGTPWTDSTGKAIIYNNVLVSNSSALETMIVGSGSGHEIYNNVIINTANSSDTSCARWIGTSNVTFKNNYLAGCDSLIYADSSTYTSDYNVFANCSSSSCFNIGGSRTGSFSTYRSAHPTQDAHSVNSLSSNGGVSSAGIPQAGSVVINNGVSLAESFTVDILGSSRPQGSAWDIGAYEFSTQTNKVPNSPSSIDVR